MITLALKYTLLKAHHGLAIKHHEIFQGGA
jgi:hypothetical protein